MIVLNVVEVSLGHRGPRYDVTMHDEVIVKSSRDPEHAAARELLARGFTGPFQTQTMTYRSIEEAAKRRVAENEKFGPHVEKFNVFQFGQAGSELVSDPKLLYLSHAKSGRLPFQKGKLHGQNEETQAQSGA